MFIILGFFALLKKNRTSTLQKIFSGLGISLALLHSRGNASQNYAYCTKSDPTGYWQHGEIKDASQGRRNDLEEVVQYVSENPHNTELDLAENFPVSFIKFNRGLKDYRNTLKRKLEREDRDITVSYFYGPGGSGKTSYAIFLCKKYNISYYIVTPPDDRQVWWYDYDGERAIIIDDFYGWLKPNVFFRICDRNKFKVNQKGTHAIADWDFVFITSNNAPQLLWKEEVWAKLDKDAFWRRLHNVFLWEWHDDYPRIACNPLVKEKEERPLNLKMSEAAEQRKY